MPHTTAYKIRQHLPVQSQTQHRHTQAHVRGRTLSDTATHSHPTNTPGHNYTRSRVTVHPHTATRAHTVAIQPHATTQPHTRGGSDTDAQSHRAPRSGLRAGGMGSGSTATRRTRVHSPAGFPRLSLHVATRLVFNVNTQSPKAHTFPRGVQGACEP